MQMLLETACMSTSAGVKFRELPAMKLWAKGGCKAFIQTTASGFLLNGIAPRRTNCRLNLSTAFKALIQLKSVGYSVKLSVKSEKMGRLTVMCVLLLILQNASRQQRKIDCSMKLWSIELLSALLKLKFLTTNCN